MQNGRLDVGGVHREQALNSANGLCPKRSIPRTMHAMRRRKHRLQGRPCFWQAQRWQPCFALLLTLFLASSPLIGIMALMPPMAKQPRLWHVFTTSCS